jgi:hypothetical protein
MLFQCLKKFGNECCRVCRVRMIFHYSIIINILCLSNVTKICLHIFVFLFLSDKNPDWSKWRSIPRISLNGYNSRDFIKQELFTVKHQTPDQLTPDGRPTNSRIFAKCYIQITITCAIQSSDQHIPDVLVKITVTRWSGVWIFTVPSYIPISMIGEPCFLFMRTGLAFSFTSRHFTIQSKARKCCFNVCEG